MSKSIVAIDLFCGVGGLTHGLSRAGVNVKAGIDLDHDCAFAFKANNRAKFIEADVAQVTGQSLREVFGKRGYKMLAGCAPCQPFSKYSQGWKDQKDDRWNLLAQFGRLVRETVPDFVTMENVPGILKEDVFQKFCRLLREQGFAHVWHEVVNCADYEVPQSRHRLVLLASRHGQIKLMDPPTTGSRQMTVRDAIGKLPPIRAGEIHHHDKLHQACEISDLNMQRIKASRPGGTWRDWPAHLVADCHKKDSGSHYGSVYGRMSFDEPAPTMTTQFYGFGNGRFGHPKQNRGLSLREGAILQSFPKNYKFCAPDARISRKTVGRLIGNAVPVNLGKAIGESFIRHVEQIGR